jgi:hypothetical protein
VAGGLGVGGNSVSWSLPYRRMKLQFNNSRLFTARRG